MKRKIFLVAFTVAMLVFALAIAASAATIYKDADGNEIFRYEVFANAEEVTAHFGFANDNSVGTIKSYRGEFPKTNEQGKELAWYITASATEGSDTVITVASGTTVGEVGSVNASGVYSFNSGFSKDKMVSVNFPDNAGITKLGFDSFGGYSSSFPKSGTNILFVYCPNTLTKFHDRFIQSTPVLVCELDDEMPITEIPQLFAHDARNLREINIPASVTKICGQSTGNGTPFYCNYMLQSVTFASDNTLTTMLNYCFYYCISLREVYLPNSLVEMGGQCFEHCKRLEKISLGASLQKTNGYSVFRLCNNLRVYYVPSTFTSVYQHTFTHDSGAGPVDTVFFYAGTREQFTAFYNAAVVGKNNDRVTGGYKDEYVIEWDSSKPDSYYTDLATEQGHKLYVVNYNVCSAFYKGEHFEDTHPCLIECTRCGLADQDPNANHNFVTVITYANGFSTAGLITSTCQNDGCACNSAPVAVDAEPIFEGFAYSTREEDGTRYGMVMSYVVNTDALKAYEINTGNTVSYGVLAIAEKNTNGNPLANDGSTDNESITTTGVTGTKAVDLIIWGSKDAWENTLSDGTVIKDLEFYITGYVIVNNQLSYFCGAQSSASLTELDTVSYSKIK